VTERSYVPSVRDAQASTHVNARPVREKAILHLGDTVSLDTVQFVLRPDRDDSVRTDIPASKPMPVSPAPAAETGDARAHIAPPKLVLRGVSGSYFGKIVPVRGRLVIGRGSESDLVLDDAAMSPRHAAIENIGDAIYLRDLGSSTGASVNGVPVRDAVLFPDDQIAFGSNRFLLEAPSLPTRSDNAAAAAQDSPNITQTMRAIPQSAGASPVATAVERNRNDIWWLIGAAALIGLGIAVLLFVRF
jgi:pSer/pThr/pTyr-binding forkhead associated (FHA) protein